MLLQNPSNQPYERHDMIKGISRITSIVPTIEGRRLLLLRSIGSLLDQELPEGLEQEILISFDSLNQNEARQTLEAVETLQGKASKRTYIRLINRSMGPGGVAEARNLALRAGSSHLVRSRVAHKFDMRQQQQEEDLKMPTGHKLQAVAHIPQPAHSPCHEQGCRA